MSELEQAELTHDSDLIAAHTELLQLELYKIRRELYDDPALVRVTIGAGEQPEKTLRGFAHNPYNGVAIFNPTSATLSVGFQAGTGLLAPLTVPPYSFATFPERYVNLSIALLNTADQQQTYTNRVSVLRLRIAPPPNAGPFGNPTAPATAAVNPGSSVTIGVAGTANVVAGNPARRELTIVNASASGWITLALGSVIPAMWNGIPIPPNGGGYQTSEYDGPVSMIAQNAGTLVSIAEV